MALNSPKCSIIYRPSTSPQMKNKELARRIWTNVAQMTDQIVPSLAISAAYCTLASSLLLANCGGSSFLFKLLSGKLLPLLSLNWPNDNSTKSKSGYASCEIDRGWAKFRSISRPFSSSRVSFQSVSNGSVNSKSSVCLSTSTSMRIVSGGRSLLNKRACRSLLIKSIASPGTSRG